VFSVLDSIKDPNTVPFGSAFPSPMLFPLQRLSRSLASASREMDPRMVVTDMSPGNPQLRRQIALRYMVGGLMLPMEELLITNGALEALNLCLQAVTEPGDLVAIEAPAFYACLQVLERLKLKAVEIPVHPRDGIDLGVLANPGTPSDQGLLVHDQLPEPHGRDHARGEETGTGGTAAPPPGAADRRRRLRRAVLRPTGAETGQGVRHRRPGDALRLVRQEPGPGYRIGWVAAGRYAQKIERLKLMTSLCASMPAQAAIADYLQHGGYDRHLRKLRYALEEQQSAMLAAIARYFPAQTRVSQPAGGYFLWLELPEQMDSLKLFQMALAQGISIAPGPIFSPTQRFRNCIRLNYGSPWTEASEKAMETLGRIVRSF
jgi:DNA-binding transcriptional MocR family regulator